MTQASEVAALLHSLIRACKDAENGFRAASEVVESRELEGLFGALLIQRRQFAGELQTLVVGLHARAETTGTIVGVLRRGWLGCKAALTNGDAYAILVECEDAEEAALSRYIEALEEEELPQEIRSSLRLQALAVQASHECVRGLRERFQH